MTVPRRLVARRLGRLSEETMKEIDKRLKLSLGIKAKEEAKGGMQK